MRTDTKELKHKYLYFFNLLYNERFDIFNVVVWDNDTDNYTKMFDFEALNTACFNIAYLGDNMLKKWHNYKSYRSVLIKRFDKKRDTLKREAYKTILRRFLCSDIVGCIIEFI